MTNLVWVAECRYEDNREDGQFYSDYLDALDWVDGQERDAFVSYSSVLPVLLVVTTWRGRTSWYWTEEGERLEPSSLDGWLQTGERHLARLHPW